MQPVVGRWRTFGSVSIYVEYQNMRPIPAFRLAELLACCLTLMTTAFALTAETNIDVGDAYVRGGADGQRWSIGTRGVEMAFECRDGAFRLSSFQNKSVNPPLEYVDAKAASAPFLTATQHFVERFTVQTVWTRPLIGAVTLDPAADNVRITVKKGEMIGFAIGPHGDYSCDQVRWPGTFDYGDGESYTSTNDPSVQQGPMWFYMIRIPGTGWMEPMDSVEQPADLREKIRIPSDKSGYRAPGTTPHVGPTVLHPSNEYDAVRVWKAPKDGTVIVRGKAEHIGRGDKDLSVLKITEKPAGALPATGLDGGWAIKSGSGRQVAVGGRPAAQLDLVLIRGGLQASFHVLAFPGTPILRQWVEYLNVGESGVMLFSPAPASLSLRGEEAASYTQYWMVGGNSQANQGKMERAAVTPAYLDMDWTEYLREAGLDVVWDDAGWAANPDIWAANREGPDFAQTVRYVAKTGMKWCLWFPGDPTSGIMDSKVGSWGNFQWRTDALGFDFRSDRAFRDEVTRFLTIHPRCSWHTCSGGSTYSHTFDIQRLGDVHYDTDAPGSDITNYYFSYLETPDRDGRITIRVTAVGANDAILQGVEIE
jgi:hypothetical protein